MSSDCGKRAPLCPSAPGRSGESVLIGVVTGTPDAARVLPLEAAMEVTPEVLALSGPVSPSEVFRFASTCRAEACTHFATGRCQLAERAVTALPEVTQQLFYCPIRARCRWYAQQGAAICRRCPQIITEQISPSPRMLRVVLGSVPADLS